MNKYLVAALVAVGPLAAGVVGAPAQAIPVFDAGNYAQNVLTAARTLQQINQQVQSLQNEARMLTNMARNLARIDFPQFERLRQRLEQIDRLMGEAQGIDFEVDRLDAQFRQLFPDSFDALLGRDRRVARARAQLDSAMATFRAAMTLQSQIVGNVRDDAHALSQIVARSQGAQGELQVSQATNQLLALAAKQQLQIQNLLAAQFRAQSIEQARRGQIERESRAAARRFLGDGRAYTPAEHQ